MNPILWAMLIFQLKHFVCDFALQTPAMIQKKGVYLHPSGLVHALLHAAGSLPALLMLSHAPVAVGAVLFAEFIIHYHADYLKAQIDNRFQLNDQTNLYWIVFGLDQLVHQLTYVGMIYAITQINF